jgi:hypothetical protein
MMSVHRKLPSIVRFAVVQVMTHQAPLTVKARGQKDPFVESMCGPCD